jgi:hypothetical protein
MSQQMHQAITPQIGGRSNPIALEIHAMFANVSTADSAGGACARSTVTLTAEPEHGSQR